MPVLDVLWAMLWMFLLIAWIWTVIGVMADVFRNPDLRGWGKAGWTIVILLIPWLGVLFYLIAHGDDMSMRQARDAERAEWTTQEYIRQSAGTSSSPAEQLTILVDLRESGAISDDEFAVQKAKVLA